MTERRPFHEVKLQWLEQLSCDYELSDRAKVIALYIVVKHTNKESELAWPSYQTIAYATGNSVKTVQRAINDLAAREWFDVVRGNGSGISTRYRPTNASIERASEERKKTDKVVTLYPQKGGQNCPKTRSNLSRNGGHNCHPNLETQTKLELNAQPHPETGAALNKSILLSAAKVEEVKAWNDWLTMNGCGDLESLGLGHMVSGQLCFKVPLDSPPTKSHWLHKAVLTLFVRRYHNSLERNHFAQIERRAG